ncbi:hypothetical protein NIES3806_33750 [Microcystis aeruginosa NIES-3806]|nr:hypothetical protein NIES3806_33750 [Microcystis aeruginosa NIES-3806]
MVSALTEATSKVELGVGMFVLEAFVLTVITLVVPVCTMRLSKTVAAEVLEVY